MKDLEVSILVPASGSTLATKPPHRKFLQAKCLFDALHQGLIGDRLAVVVTEIPLLSECIQNPHNANADAERGVRGQRQLRSA